MTEELFGPFDPPPFETLNEDGATPLYIASKKGHEADAQELPAFPDDQRQARQEME